MSNSDTAPVHVMANFTVHDPAKYRVYEKGFFPILKKHGGTFITFDDDSTTFEGSAPPRGSRSPVQISQRGGSDGLV